MNNRDKKLACAVFSPPFVESALCDGDDQLPRFLEELRACKTIYDQMNCFGIVKHHCWTIPLLFLTRSGNGVFVHCQIHLHGRYRSLLHRVAKEHILHV